MHYKNWLKSASERKSVDFYGQISSMGPSDSREVDFSNEYNRRGRFISEYSWAVPSKEAIEKIVKWSSGGKIIEIGAGRGLWARLLRDAGASVEASDPNPPNENSFFKNWGNSEKQSDHTFYPVEKMRGEEHASKSSTNDTLMLVWPYFESSGDDDWQASAVRNFKGNKIVFVGEREGGATGSPEFWEEMRKGWEERDYAIIPKWTGMHDDVALYVRSSP